MVRQYDNDLNELCAKFNFCGCGDPEGALRYVLGALKLLKTQAELCSMAADKDWHNNWEKMQAERLKYFQSSWAETFAWYMLTNLGMIKHGGSIPGWLTEKGERVVMMLETFFRKYPKGDPQDD